MASNLSGLKLTFRLIGNGYLGTETYQGQDSCDTVKTSVDEHLNLSEKASTFINIRINQISEVLALRFSKPSDEESGEIDESDNEFSQKSNEQLQIEIDQLYETLDELNEKKDSNESVQNEVQGRKDAWERFNKLFVPEAKYCEDTRPNEEGHAVRQSSKTPNVKMDIPKDCVIKYIRPYYPVEVDIVSTIERNFIQKLQRKMDELIEVIYTAPHSTQQHLLPAIFSSTDNLPSSASEIHPCLLVITSLNMNGNAEQYFKERIDKSRPDLNIEAICYHLNCLANTLGYLANKGIHHGNLHPGNIFIYSEVDTIDILWKIGDFLPLDCLETVVHRLREKTLFVTPHICPGLLNKIRDASHLEWSDLQDRIDWEAVDVHGLGWTLIYIICRIYPTSEWLASQDNPRESLIELMEITLKERETLLLESGCDELVTLLKKMTKEVPNERPRFKEILIKDNNNEKTEKDNNSSSDINISKLGNEFILWTQKKINNLYSLIMED